MCCDGSALIIRSQIWFLKNVLRTAFWWGGFSLSFRVRSDQCDSEGALGMARALPSGQEAWLPVFAEHHRQVPIAPPPFIYLLCFFFPIKKNEIQLTIIKVYNSAGFSIWQVYRTIVTISNSRAFSSSPQNTPHLLVIAAILPPPAPALATMSLLSVSRDMPLLGVPYQWHLCVWILSLGVMVSSFIHTVAHIRTSFLWTAE